MMPDARPNPGIPKFRYIDALRGLAIFGVIVVHVTTSVHGLPFWLYGLGRSGHYGVQLFYVVSAFTLFLSMSRRTRREFRPTVNFFIRRFARIAPLFYAISIFCLLYYGRQYAAWRSAPGLSSSAIVSTLTFTNAWNPYWITSLVPGGWSVAIEMCFYLLVPLLFFWITSLTRAVILTIVAVILSIVLDRFAHQHAHAHIPGGWPGWLQGCYYLIIVTLFLCMKFPRTAASLLLIEIALCFTIGIVLDHRLPMDAAPQWSRDLPADAAHHHSAKDASSAPVSSTTGPLPAAAIAAIPTRSGRAPAAAPVFSPTESWKTFLFFWLPNQFPIFCMGIMLYFLYRRFIVPRHIPSTQSDGQSPPPLPVQSIPPAPENPFPWIFLAIVAAAIVILPFLGQFRINFTPVHLLYGVAFVLLAISLALRENPILVNGFWTFLGKVSYSAYLLHQPVLAVVEKLQLPPLISVGKDASSLALETNAAVLFLVRLVLATLATLLVSAVTFYLIEQPGQSLGKRLIRSLEARPSSAIPQSPLAAAPQPG